MVGLAVEVGHCYDLMREEAESGSGGEKQGPQGSRDLICVFVMRRRYSWLLVLTRVSGAAQVRGEAQRGKECVDAVEHGGERSWTLWAATSSGESRCWRGKKGKGAD